MLVRPLMFSASLLYSQEMVPNSFSCAQLKIYSTELPKKGADQEDHPDALILCPAEANGQRHGARAVDRTERAVDQACTAFRFYAPAPGR